MAQKEKTPGEVAATGLVLLIVGFLFSGSIGGFIASINYHPNVNDYMIVKENGDITTAMYDQEKTKWSNIVFWGCMVLGILLMIGGAIAASNRKRRGL